MNSIISNNHFASNKNPYLQKHANNPVLWRVWSASTLELAKQQNKPLFVSIGYASCHWCHVMNRESFQNEDIAAFLNKHFLPIKIDREERPDIDSIYLRSAELLGVQGGWPLSVFATPQGAPFFVGTYFPPQERMGLVSFLSVLQHCEKLWRTKNADIVAYAQKVQTSTQQSFYVATAKEEASKNDFSEDILLLKQSLQFPTLQFFPEDRIFAEIYLKFFDSNNGGFKWQGSNKFLHFMGLQHLLRIATREQRADLWHVVTFTLQKMFASGVYDFVAGGFFRYATDYKFCLPHFEKTLYDNALALQLLVDVAASPLHEQFAVNSYENADSVGGDYYLQKALEVYYFLQENLLATNGLYYSALDAESDGEEGLYYCISENQFSCLLQTFAKQHRRYLNFNSNIENSKNIQEDKALFGAKVFFDTFFKREQLAAIGYRYLIFAKGLSRQRIKKFALLGCQASEKSLLVMYYNFIQLLANLRAEKSKVEVDAKNLLGWNALLLSSLCALSTALLKITAGKKNCVKDSFANSTVLKFFLQKKNTSLWELANLVSWQAQTLGAALQKNFATEEGLYYRRLAYNEKFLKAQLNDYAAMGRAMCHLQQLMVRLRLAGSLGGGAHGKVRTAKLLQPSLTPSPLTSAKNIAAILQKYFYGEQGLFLQTQKYFEYNGHGGDGGGKDRLNKNSDGTESVMGREAAGDTLFKYYDLQEEVEPCGNSLAADFFMHLGILFPKKDYSNIANNIFIASYKPLAAGNLPHMLGVVHNFRLGCWRLLYKESTKKNSDAKKSVGKWLPILLDSKAEDRVCCFSLENAVKEETWLSQHIKKSGEVVLLCQHSLCLLPAYDMGEVANRFAGIR